MEFITVIQNSPLPMMLGGVLSATFVIFRKRDWEVFSNKFRVMLGITSSALSILIGIISWTFLKNWEFAFALSGLTSITLIALYTDLKWRLVRSDIFWIYTVVSLIYWPIIPEYQLLPFVCMLGAGAAAMLLPFLGQSDARAFIASVALVFPAAGPLGIVYSLMVAAVFLTVFAIALAVYKVVKNHSLSLGKVYLAAVPIITGSFIGGLLLSLL